MALFLFVCVCVCVCCVCVRVFFCFVLFLFFVCFFLCFLIHLVFKTFPQVAVSGSVERRHKHFVWLYERLRDKYSCMCVPPLPDKSYMPKYGENFLDKRQQKLSDWLNRVARHPVLSRDRMSLHHFLTCPTSDTKVVCNLMKKS